jgi:hypothetical protein
MDQNVIPVPKLDERPFPKSGVAFSQPQAAPPAYPFLPSAPPQSVNGRIPGGAGPYAYPGRPQVYVQRKHRRSLFPVFVRLFFLVVEVLLLIRLLSIIFGIFTNTVWIAAVYTLSSFFLLPFQMLLENVKIPFLNGTALYFDLLLVCAIFVYGLISRILVRFLKAFLN